jgi:nucleoside diphosphate kinase
VTYFEPGALASQDVESCKAELKLWAEYSDTDGGLLNDIVCDLPKDRVQQTLVLIKPDNFRFPSARPGGVIDLFSRTGLCIAGFKVHRMSVAQAEEFYGPVLEVLQRIYKERAAKQARPVIEKELGVTLNDELDKGIGEWLGPVAALANWEAIIEFMAGCKPSACPREKLDEPGTEKCIALVYEGEDAVAKIRKVLGPTDPSKAPPGSIRREFGSSIMINAAHASDSPENAQREMNIVDITGNNLKTTIEKFYSNQ